MTGMEHNVSQRASGRRTALPLDELRAVLRIADAFLRAIETSVWEVRLAAERLARDARQGHTRGKQELDLTVQKLARFSQTATAFAKVVTSYRLHVTASAFLTRAAAARRLESLHAKNGLRLRMLAEKHGGALLKVGQLLSTRADVLPEPIVTELSHLQDAAPRVPFEIVRSHLETSLGKPIEALFASFDEAPLAAASIGQVHRATLLDGTEVAVKVKRPGIDALVAQDLSLLAVFLDALAPLFPPTDHATIAREVEASVLRELDLGSELLATERARAAFADDENVIVPEVFRAVSSKAVLVTRFVRGTKITDALDALESDDARSQVLGTLIQSYVRMILEHGELHSDPHPGNVLVTDDLKIIFLDFGSVTLIDDATRREYLRLVMAFVANDRDTVVDALHTIGFRTKSGRPDTLLVFADALLGSFAKAQGEAQFPTKEELIAEAKNVIAVAEHDPVLTLPPEFIMIARVFGSISGLFLVHRPKLDVATWILPALGRAMAR